MSPDEDRVKKVRRVVQAQRGVTLAFGIRSTIPNGGTEVTRI